MRIRLLELKAIMEREGVLAVDFLDSTLQVNYFSRELQVDRVLLVEERHLARPDLLSQDAYGAPDHVDVILKFNMITNPFSMEEGDIIVAPNLGSVEAFYRRGASSPVNVLDTKSLFIDPSKTPKKDAARVEQLARIAKRKSGGAREVKPTHLLRIGEEPFRTDGTALRLAPDA